LRLFRVHTIHLSTVLPLLFAVAGVAADPDRILTPRESFVSAASGGLAEAGVALPWSSASALANPALLYSCRNGASKISRSLSFGFGRDSLFDRFIIPVGAAYSRKWDAVALNARALSSSDSLDEYEAVITYCKRVLSRSDRNGPLDIGANLHYEYADWEKRSLDSLPIIRRYLSQSTGKRLRADEIAGYGIAPESGNFRENRMYLDIGIFKPEIDSHFDGGIALKNIGGIRWGRESPDTVTVDTASIRGDTLVRTVSRSYTSTAKGYFGVIGWRYTSLCAGGNIKFAIPAGKFSFCLPVEIDLFNLFYSPKNIVCSIRTGLQVHLLQDYFVRVGYSRAPGLIHANETIKLEDNLSFGLSILPPGTPLAIDCYFSHWEWGLSVGADY
jgi:hypothetical protein